MQANPSTAHPCAHDDNVEAFKELLANATTEQLTKVKMLIYAISYHDLDALDALEGLISQSNNVEELALLTPLLEKLKAELAIARFQPVFTKQQLQDRETNIQPEKDAVRRLALSVLCMSEKKLTHIAANNLPVFADLVSYVQSFVEDTKTQLELSECALARLLLIGHEAAEGVE